MSKLVVEPKRPLSVAELSAQLRALQRQRVWHLKSRMMVANRLQATVAGEECGYSSSMPEKERRKCFVEASELVERIAAGEATTKVDGIVKTTILAIQGFESMKVALEKEMKKLAGQLPVARWVQEPEQRGFGILFLGIVIGETGDLNGYENPAKVWRRLGCAPWTFDDKTLMGSTWRIGKEGRLPASEWEAFGYSPRRRSIAYLIGEGLVKQNGGSKVCGEENGEKKDVTDAGITARPCGPYRARYDEAKVLAKQSHPDWSDLRCHRHGMLLATKRLLRELWIQWRK